MGGVFVINLRVYPKCQVWPDILAELMDVYLQSTLLENSAMGG